MVQVLVDGQWLPGEIRAQSQDDHGVWTIHANYRDGVDTYFAGFTVDQVRPDDTDHSHGRTATAPVEEPSEPASA